MKTLGDFLCAKRMDRGYSHEALGKILNLSTASLSNWERNISVPSRKNLNKLAAYYEIDERDFDPYLEKKEGNKVSKEDKKTPVTNMIATLKRNRIKMLEDLKSNEPALIKVRERIAKNIDICVDKLTDLMIIEDLFFD